VGDQDELLDSLILELRRGTIVLSVLGQLEKPQYGYYLVQELEGKGLAVDPGTLYPLLRRLEKQGLLGSTWDTSEARPRKYYVLSTDGLAIYRRLKAEWKAMTGSIDSLIGEGGKQDGDN
jgi:PadR family transcriptional regulator, regulatory protein PadR